MITLEYIDENLINIDNDYELPDNFVAVAVKIDEEGNARHSALLIGVNGIYSLFHYYPPSVSLENPLPDGQWYFCKELEIVNGNEFSLNFLAHCQLILEEDDPQYGFLFDGSYYDQNGTYFTETNIRNYTTCVGFCIKVISGFIQNHSKYFELGDWDFDTTAGIRINHSQYFQEFVTDFIAQNPTITPDVFKNYYKRITPSEYTASAFISDLPIRKSKIEEILNDVNQSLSSKRGVA